MFVGRTCGFAHKITMDAIRAKLDDLMGPDRDGVAKPREVTVGIR